MVRYMRQSELLVPQDTRGYDVDIAGGGSAGGAITVCLTKMGLGVENRITVTDDDVCKLHNLPTQWFRESDVKLRLAKVVALADMTQWISGHEISVVQGRFTGAEERPLGPIVILAVDTLVERRRIWENLKRRDDVALLIDVRMGGTVMELFALLPREDDRTGYERSLEAPDEAFPMPCGEEAILFTVLGGASFVGSVVRSFIRGEEHPTHLAFDFRHFLLETA